MPRKGLEPFVKQITQSGTGQFAIVSAGGPDECLRVHEMYGMCSVLQEGTYGTIEFSGDCPQFAVFFASPEPQVLKPAGSPPVSCDIKSRHLIIDVLAVKGGTNGFADIKAWVWGVVERIDEA